MADLLHLLIFFVDYNLVLLLDYKIIFYLITRCFLSDYNLFYHHLASAVDAQHIDALGQVRQGDI